jgi:poly-gamma-glutamate capsule biosynthesis protein CapA/YwtB (metallophosphatase superfamily)
LSASFPQIARALIASALVAGCGSKKVQLGDGNVKIVDGAAAVDAADVCSSDIPRAACRDSSVRLCKVGESNFIGNWRFALVGRSFDATIDLTAAQLAEAWRSGKIAVMSENRTAIVTLLGPTSNAPRFDANAADPFASSPWAIVAVDQLRPSWSLITVDGKDPIVGDNGVLRMELCGSRHYSNPISNIERQKLTILVMSGTTALTGRTAERLDQQGVDDTIRYIKPFFASADLVHISNEVSFVRDCHPRTGQKELIFCARDSYVAVLDKLNAKLIELTGSHLVDYGSRPLLRTIDEYAKRGWIWFGGGRTQLDATTPRIVEHHGNRLAFVGCNAVNWWVDAISTGPGAATCDWPRMIWQIQDLRRRGLIPIATVQHRELRNHAPPPDLVNDLRQLAEAGAMFVLGSQAHVAHPWDVHYGAYVHYGPGNILFAQYRDEQRDASVDKLYVYEGRLLAVSHIFTRTEHGQPRQLSTNERAKFLGKLEVAATVIAAPNPDGKVIVPAESSVRPDSLVAHGHRQYLSVSAPREVVEGKQYRLVVKLDASVVADDDSFVVERVGTWVASGREIAEFMTAKYPIDSSRITFVPAELGSVIPPHPAHHHRHASRPLRRQH